MTVARTSLDAYETVNINDRQADVYECIKKLGACSDLEIANELCWPINRVTPRRGELVEAGLVIRAGEKPGPTGRRCTVWTLPRRSPEQIDLFAQVAA